MATQLAVETWTGTLTHAPIRRPAKVLLVGEACAGKSTIVSRICTGQFNSARSVTVGVDFQVKEVSLGPAVLKLIFWDVAGQERFVSLRSGFYRGGQAVALVYDLTNRTSFDRLRTWVAEVQYYLPGVPKVLVGNKLDLATVARAVSREEADSFAQAHGLYAYETSCATGQGVGELLRGLSCSVVRHLARNRSMGVTESG